MKDITLTLYEAELVIHALKRTDHRALRDRLIKAVDTTYIEEGHPGIPAITIRLS